MTQTLSSFLPRESLLRHITIAVEQALRGQLCLPGEVIPSQEGKFDVSTIAQAVTRLILENPSRREAETGVALKPSTRCGEDERNVLVVPINVSSNAILASVLS